MTAEQWARTVRHQLGLGRLLPLGGPRDGAWISEDAATAVLRAAVEELRDVRLGGVRIGLADPADAREPAVPPPPSALPPGPLRLTAEFEATLAQPVPVTAERLRSALARTAAGSLGLELGAVDLRVTGLLDEESPRERQPEEPRPVEPAAAGSGDEGRAGEAALAVSGVTGLTGLLGRPVQITERASEGALPRRHVRVELAVDRRALDVARAVRARVEQALPDHPTVTVLVTAVPGQERF